ncbi:conserved hypothetical protein [Vibrio coralliirubri]|uniref:hypothetical protein n=1 Tax=Vibrio coralliirubri TaxID=1516159 RepID=UPI00063A8359|nr:hypothetical protein [Vibrio coralliirubri]CDT53647.1 conserved hypothetical protein [Vibrio coralliirubri]
MSKALTIMDLVAKKQKEIQAKKGRARPFKFPIGKTKIRLLPSWRLGDDPQFFHDFGSHYIKNDKGETEAVYVCTEKTFGQDCEICKAIGMGIKSAHDDETIELLKDANSGQQYLMNAIVRGDANNKEPVLIAAGIGIFESICEIIAEYGDITDLKEGVDLTISREGSGRNDTKYTVIPAAKSESVPKEVLGKALNLDEYVSQENESGLHKALTAVGSAAGLLMAPKSSPATAGAGEMGAIEDKSLSKSIAEELKDDAVDADFEEVPEMKEAPIEDDINEDELDELLADLDG